MSPIQTVHVRIPIFEPDLLLMWLTSQTGKVGYLALLLSQISNRWNLHFKTE